jgi:hypothetical protein
LIRRAVALALGCLALAGCSSLPSVSIKTDATLNTMLGVEAAYGSALTAARAYKALPLCRTGTKATVTDPCAQRSVVVKLQEADLRAVAAIDQANEFIKAYPTVDASNFIAAARTAVDVISSTLAEVK